jgi:hypothetical protein
MPEHHPSEPIPRWAKIQGVFVLLLILVVLAMSSGLLRHGPGGHGAAPASGERQAAPGEH